MAYSEEVLNRVQERILAETKKMREYNRTVRIGGERREMRVSGRTVPYVWYSCGDAPAPLILGFHGGGYLFGGAASNDSMWRATADFLHCHVASVEYRMSPEYQYMAAIEDAYDSACWFFDNAEALGADRSRIMTMGMSAGANLAAAVCLYAKRQGKKLFSAQILLYPMLDACTDPDSKGSGSLQGPVLYLFNRLHAPETASRDPLVSPVFAGSAELEGLPAAVIAVADNDALQAEGLRYGELLRAAGTPAAVMKADQMPHGYFEIGFGKPTKFDTDFLGRETLAQIEDGSIHARSEETLAFINRHLEGETAGTGSSF